MTASGWHPALRTHRKVVMVFYWMLVLTSLGPSTAIRKVLHCNNSFLPVGVSSRSSSQSWRNQIFYAGAAATAARSSEDQMEEQPGGGTSAPHLPNNNTTTTLYDEPAADGSAISSSTDYSIVSGTCAGNHGLEVQQDNTSAVYLRGLPVYHVSMINTCVECSLSDIHISCGNWASATEVNPHVFKRVADNDCVVNDGKPIISQGSLYFEYSNSFAYPMDVYRATPSCS